MNISVCIASYNGEKYITTQLESILSQLGPIDEVIVVDDASTDSTFETVCGLDDRRLKIYRNDVNLGPARTFDRALHLAKGEIIFLSDQDDYWYQNKVSVILNTFVNMRVDLIVHDARIVYMNGDVEGSLFKRSNSGPGVWSNIVRNSYTGCCMVFRRSVLNSVLPISPRIGLFHDAWIGVLAEAFGFKVYFLNNTLIDFIRHGQNASVLNNRTIFVILYDRIRFILALSAHFFWKRIIDIFR